MSPKAPLHSEAFSELPTASASSGRLACFQACLEQTSHVNEAADEVGRVREIFRARLKRINLAHQKELAKLHLRIGELVAAQGGLATQRLAQAETFGTASQIASGPGQASKLLAPGRKPAQAVASVASGPWSARWVYQARPHESDRRKGEDAVSGGRNNVPQLAPVAASRVLLQEQDESTDGTCSADDLMAVQADSAAALVKLMTTNMGCAMCLIPCASAANTLGCAVRCIKQARPLSRLDRPSPTACELALCVR
jgi:hypothetical protein